MATHIEKNEKMDLDGKEMKCVPGIKEVKALGCGVSTDLDHAILYLDTDKGVVPFIMEPALGLAIANQILEWVAEAAKKRMGAVQMEPLTKVLSDLKQQREELDA